MGSFYDKPALKTEDYHDANFENKSESWQLTGFSVYLFFTVGNGPACIENQVIRMPALSSLVAPQVVIMTTCGATSDYKVDIITTLNFQCLLTPHSINPSLAYDI